MFLINVYITVKLLNLFIFCFKNKYNQCLIQFTDRARYGTEGTERGGMFKDISPSREDARLRHSQGFSDDRRR